MEIPKICLLCTKSRIVIAEQPKIFCKQYKITRYNKQQQLDEILPLLIVPIVDDEISCFDPPREAKIGVTITITIRKN